MGVESLEGMFFLPTAKVKVTKRNVALAAFMLTGGKATAKEINKKIRRIADHLKIGTVDSSAISKLTKEGLLERDEIKNVYTYKPKDWLNILERISKEQALFRFIIEEVNNNYNLMEKLISNFLINYSRNHHSTFHVRDEFLKDYESIVGKEFEKMIEDRLPIIIGRLKANGVIETTIGNNGIIVNGEPIALIHVKEA